MERNPCRHRKSLNVAFATGSRDLLRMVARELGWTEQTSPARLDSTIYWFETASTPDLVERVATLNAGQFLNKFPSMNHVLDKAPLCELLNRLNRLFPGDFSFFPRSWLFPGELTSFKEHLSRGAQTSRRGRKTYILKPSSGSGGDGIMLVQKGSDLPYRVVEAVAQLYIERPLLVDGFKFDLRLYVLLTSVQPLVAFVAREGLARLCTEQYKAPDPDNLHHCYMHLSNYSLNKHSRNFEFCEDGAEGAGSKQTASSVFRRIEEAGYDAEILWNRICSVIARTLVAIQAPVTELSEDVSKCFQVLGFDILLDEGLQPHLLEVNSNPSMRVDFEREVSPGVNELVPSPVDRQVKACVMSHAFQILVGQSNPVSVFEPIGFESLSHFRIFDLSRLIIRRYAGMRSPNSLSSIQFCRLCNQAGLGRGPASHADFDIAYKRFVPAGRKMGCIELVDALVQLVEDTNGNNCAEGGPSTGGSVGALRALVILNELLRDP